MINITRHTVPSTQQANSAYIVHKTGETLHGTRYPAHSKQTALRGGMKVQQPQIKIGMYIFYGSCSTDTLHRTKYPANTRMHNEQ